MNRFRTKKKGKDEDGAPRPSQDSESSMPFRGFRKGKKSQETDTKPIDLATALPSNDDFRTSLLMTGLSARFSMLREQDDPNTKIGKASDDSVLFPKRQSRMDMSSFRGLGDIAEVESLKAASPFARTDSYHSDDADSMNAGGVMNRAKPTEGNNLFGGRQKIYKIPAGISSSKPVDGGMSGRALYDDDVAQSAFQKWRRAEKERKALQDEADGDDELDERHSSTDLDPPRSESPAFSSYNRNRETSSTLSSLPSIARNSSAATSITSTQPPPSLKDWQPPTTSSSGPERSVTRTRRLYETGFFSNDTQESTSGNLSRIDTLNRQRPFGTRTPELGQHSSSSGALNGVSDRQNGERRLLAKGSAPSLRSMSPPASVLSKTTSDLGIRVPSAGESRSNFPGAPPLSPPLSEGDEISILPIDPNDRGKATALGVFQKPAQPYNESRYAQRQLQMQRGRETPTQRRSRDEPSLALHRSQSRSPSPARKEEVDSPTVPIFPRTQAPVRDQVQPTSFFVDADESETSSIHMSSPQVHLQRPSDTEHPAFRESALPTPLSLDVHLNEPSPITEILSSRTDSKGVSPEDSPTLGPVPDNSGLSGMVRQHLRGVSNASSIYDITPSSEAPESRFPTESANSKALPDYGAGSNPWGGEDLGRDWNLDLDVNEPIPYAESFASDSGGQTGAKMNPDVPEHKGTDQFANQLADGARRIRERLTSFVETDSRSSSPHRIGEQKDATDLPPLPRSGGLGSILRPKSSKGSLVDRGREPSSKAFKMMGISPGASRAGSPGNESQKGQAEANRELAQEREQGKEMPPSAEEHPGLRAFREARRELQRHKETETQLRHHPAPQGPPPDIPSSQPRTVRQPGAPRTRTSSRDRKPPPVYYQQRMPSEESRNGGSPPNSRTSSGADRQGSESESSNGARSNSRPPHMGGLMSGRENIHLGPGGSGPRPPMRSPGLPGTDIKRSPNMPPQLHPNTSSRMNQSNLTSNGKLHAPRGYESGLPSPVSPSGSPFVNSALSSPSTLSPRTPVGQNLPYDNSTAPIPGVNDAMRRKVRPRDISEPTFVMSSSRVNTVALPAEAEGNRSRSNSRAAPPVPPINPRRRQDSNIKVRTMLDSFSRHGRDSVERDGNASTPNLPLGESINDGERRNTIMANDGDESRADPRRPQRAMGDVANKGMNFNMSRGHNGPISTGPPASRMVVTQGRNHPGNAGSPGGMI